MKRLWELRLRSLRLRVFFVIQPPCSMFDVRWAALPIFSKCRSELPLGASNRFHNYLKIPTLILALLEHLREHVGRESKE